MVSLVGPGTVAPWGAHDQEKGACAGTSGVWGDSSVQVDVASEGACVETLGPLEDVGGTAAEILDTFLAVQVEAEIGEGRSQDPVEGSLRWGSGLPVQLGVQGRTGERHWKAEEGPCHLGGWR